ncbi:MAG: PDZ domain-containing protein [Phycisphaerae bacterium]|nr:PDZ domain-containing protein [Phycisphaerae bacterium]
MSMIHPSSRPPSARFLAAILRGSVLASPALAASLLAAPWCPPVLAQNADPQNPDPEIEDLGPPTATNKQREARVAELTKRSFDAFDKRDWKAAEEALRALIPLDEQNFVPRYNLGCALASQGRAAEAMEAVVDAIEHGFVDRRHLVSDPFLESIRTDPGTREPFERLVANWGEVLKRHRDANAAAAKKEFPSAKDAGLNEDLRLVYLSSFNPKSFDAARGEIDLIGRWAGEVLFREAAPDAASNDSWAVVILPNRREFLRWAIATYGQAAMNNGQGIGGSYSHDDKRLVAQDLGSSFRHEFMHVLHWRDCTRRGQLHPIWVMEGLCSLVEDYDLDSAGKLVPATSWRSNTVKRLEKAGLLMSIEKLCALPRDRFMTGRPLAMYAQARTLFLYLSDQGKLEEWYAAFCETFKNDPTGVEAFERVFAKPIKQINLEYRAWVKALQAVPEEIPPGAASLGIEVDWGQGEGPIVAAMPDRLRKNGPKIDLRKGDIITAIDAKPVRDIAELVRVLSAYAPGQPVELTYRRGKLHGTTTITLVPKM